MRTWTWCSQNTHSSEGGRAGVGPVVCGGVGVSLRLCGGCHVFGGHKRTNTLDFAYCVRVWVCLAESNSTNSWGYCSGPLAACLRPFATLLGMIGCASARVKYRGAAVNPLPHTSLPVRPLLLFLLPLGCRWFRSDGHDSNLYDNSVGGGRRIACCAGMRPAVQLASQHRRRQRQCRAWHTRLPCCTRVTHRPRLLTPQPPPPGPPPPRTPPSLSPYFACVST